MIMRGRLILQGLGVATSDTAAEAGAPDRRSVVKNGASTHLHRWESEITMGLLVVISHERGIVSGDVIAKCDECWGGAWRRENIS